MKVAKMREIGRGKTTIDTFYGYNHNPRIGSGEFYDMKNLASDHFPILHPRPPRNLLFNNDPYGIAGMIWMSDALWFVPGGGTHSTGEICRYDGNTVTPYEIDSMSSGEKRLVSFGAYILIFPDALYINTADPTEFGSIDAYFDVDGGNLAFAVCDDTGAELILTVSDTAPSDPENGQMWMKTLDPYHTEYYKFSEQNAAWLPFTAYLKISASQQVQELQETVYVSDVYDQDDTIHMRLNNDRSMFSNDATYRIVTKGNGFIVIPTDGVKLTASSVSPPTPQMRFWRTMPNLDFVFEHDNRLWGCCWYLDSSTNKIINEIHASKLGDFKNWNSFHGISTDSYVISCGSDGKWTGAAEVGGYPCFFKERHLHKVYGNLPENYSCDPVEVDGVQEGCDRSLAILNGVLYYKSRRGVMRYDGSLPTEVSSDLGNVFYSNAVGGAFDGKYYVSMTDGTDYHLFAYDAAKKIWHKEDQIQALQFCSTPNGLLMYDGHPDAVQVIHGGFFKGESAADIEWSAETGIIGEELPEHKYYPQMMVRMSMMPGAHVRFYAEFDSSGRWEQIAYILGRNLRSFTLPIRTRRCDHMRLKIVGKGDVSIYSITYLTEKGSEFG